MKVSLPYHDSSLKVELPEKTRIEGAECPLPLGDPGMALVAAVEKPVSSCALGDAVPREGRIALLIPDLTRGGGSGSILLPLLGYLEKLGAGPERVEVFVAAGLHRSHTPDELEMHLGEEIVRRYRVNEHDARDYDSMVSIGKTPAGTECEINERVADSSLVIGLGAVSFHYFAGFGGGRKLILPGVASERSIIANHRLSLRNDPRDGLAEGCRPGNIDGNPVNEDMTAAARLLPAPIFMVNAVFDADGAPVFINAGDIVDSHIEAASYLAREFTFRIERPYKAVIASAGGRPGDMNLLQSHKAIRNASVAVESGGVLMMAAACPEGIGSESLREAFCGSRSRLPDRVAARYTVNSQTAVSIFEMAGRLSIYLRTMLADSDVTNFGFCPWKDGYTSCLIAGMDPDEILVIKDAARFLPVVGR